MLHLYLDNQRGVAFILFPLIEIRNNAGQLKLPMIANLNVFGVDLVDIAPNRGRAQLSIKLLYHQDTGSE